MSFQELLTYELGYINTRHEDFVGFNFAEQKAYRRVIKRRNPGAQTTVMIVFFQK
jgi:hypothetical protein